MSDPTLPVRVPLVTEPWGVLKSLSAARRNVLSILPEIATRQPMVSGKTGKRWHMVMDPGAIRHMLLDRLEDYPKSDVTKNLLRPAIGESLFIAEGAHWYEKAISEILRNDPDARFALFSDDFVYARSILPNNIEIMEITQNSGPKSYVDMLMMSRCKNNIISNSTFSWWGAWLNDTNGKTIIAPSNWFHPSSELIDSDIVPSTWIKI